MFKYFERNYAWNPALATLIEEVGTLADPEVANLAWRDAMSKLAERFERLFDQDLAEGHRLTASRKYHRAAMYFIRVERMASHCDSRRLETYRRALANLPDARELGKDGVEFVDIPYQNGAIPALLVKAGGDKPMPIVIHLQGFDSEKETQWAALQEYRGVVYRYSYSTSRVPVVRLDCTARRRWLRAIPTCPGSSTTSWGAPTSLPSRSGSQA